MKKIITTLALTTLTFAQVQAFNPASQIPLGPTQFVEINLSKFPQLKSILLDQIQSNPEFPEIIKPEYLDQIAFANYTTSTGSKQIYLLSLTETQFNQLISSIPSEELQTTNLSYNKKIYQFNGINFAYKNGYLIAGDATDLLTDLIQMQNFETLSSDQFFKQSQQLKTVNNLFFYIQSFTDLQKNQYNFFHHSPFLNLIKNLENQSVTLEDNGDEITFNSLMSTGELNFTKSNFNPKLIQKFQTENQILGSEFYSIKNQLELLGLDFNSPEIRKFQKELKSETNIDLTTDVLASFNANIFFGINHDTDQIIPSLTLVSLIESNPTAAQSFSEKLKTYIQNQITTYKLNENQEYQPYLINLTEENFNNQKYVTINFTLSDYGKSDIPETLHIKFTFKLSWTIKDNKYLILTTEKSPTKIFSTIESLPTETSSNEQYLGISNLNFQNLNKYLTQLKQSINEINPNQTDPFFNSLPDLSSLNQLTSYSKIENNNYKSTAKLTVNRPNFDKLLAEIISVFTTFLKQNNYNNEYNYDSTNYNEKPAIIDISYDTTPFFNEIDNLYYLDLIKGYTNENGSISFKPANPINRAEFTKLLIETKNRVTNSTHTSSTEQVFSDVDPNSWYGQFIYQAKSEELIQGYNDGTFKPEAIITKAEALEIIYKILKLQSTKIRTELPEINKTDWYYNSSNKIYNDLVLQQNNYSIRKFFHDNNLTHLNYNPTAPLTRAEAAALIYTMYTQLFWN